MNFSHLKIITNEQKLILFTSNFRTFYKFIIWPIMIVGLLGNICVLIRLFLLKNINKKNSIKPFHKLSLLSLALSDILFITTTGINILSLINNETNLWKLPNFFCYYLPYLQSDAVIVASLTLAAIAINRYTAIKLKFPQTHATGWYTIFFYIVIWSLASAVSYPTLELYKPESLIIINNSTLYTGILCVGDKQNSSIIFTILFVIIFVPLGIVFVVIHIMLIIEISNRKLTGHSVRAHHDDNKPSSSQDDTTGSTNLETIKINNYRKILPSHVLRKRRTIRIILFLIIIFLLCRLPQWIYLLIKLHVKLDDGYWWYIQILLTTLSLLNATLNPFFYTFLNESLSLIAWIRLLSCFKNNTIL
ncbi:hypothetical protein HCN44_007333 [Aphidius gifuensis]|uniref:G-protein coupled receptors family 1 profile domain-containing protein n=1 Tax=Aphidius gifuensis TaxID=684658 RepID=A0A834XKS1_APHGI|nr:beta-2 adrenergic receptor [Aphidius gifuensis]KAF7989023.1 hypothetical protein HCN44_007333 [Aphidius gifuensis]